MNTERKSKRGWGGPRVNAGGARPGAGRPRQNLHIGYDRAIELRTLTLHQRGLNPAATEDQVVEALIERAWRQLDQAFQDAAERDANG